MLAQFAADRAAILAAIQSAGDPNAAHQAAMHAHQRQQDGWQSLIGDILYTAGSAGGSHLIADWQDSETGGGADDLADYDPDAEEDDANGLTAWIAANQNDLAQRLHDHLNDMLSNALIAALALGGLSLLGLSDAVNNLYDQWTGQSGDSNYAETLAGDWTAAGWNYGEWDAAQQASQTASGTDVTRTWNAVGDAHTRPAHAAADGQTVGLNEPFSVGGEDLMYPGDPSGSPRMVNGCRCWLTYALPSGETADASAFDESGA